MKQEYKILLWGLIAICLCDILGAIASRQFNFNAAILAPVSFIIYIAFGFAGTQRKRLTTGLLISAGIGLFDSTIGWKISMLLKANTGNLKNNPTIPVWISTAIFVTILASLCGLFGGGLAMLVKKYSKAT
ncbi:hypothetical protein [Mucilaginibacter aquariorum]|uniref:Uncharacterized protein n=1 Tax=Mucilaginibacter aquariorum TaxID=2967225 RepID=A0ABT1T9R7_9SPHI|nr:hypothetical protein [Mucilaginibacter aquariorum]MCQ6961198.1 hypothetical protein [Mucilaginibacter aquariorum]